MRACILVIAVAAVALAQQSAQDTPRPDPPTDGIPWNTYSVEQGLDCFEGSPCMPARLSIRPMESEDVIGLKMFTVAALIIASNVSPPALAVTKMDVTMIFETADHVKQTQTRSNVPIQDYATGVKGQPPLKYASALFSSMDVPIVKVLSIDAVEKVNGPDGKTLQTNHKFRPK